MDETSKVREIILKNKEKTKKQKPILDDGRIYPSKLLRSDKMESVHSQPEPSENNKKKVFLLRHGERVDFSFGSWIPYSFDKNSKFLSFKLRFK